jgi:hypothetical protein
MKQSERIAICLASGLMVSASARAVTAEAQGNPYQGVVERNVFALKPPPPPGSEKPPAPEPPKIIPQGIMSMFGRQQVLFKAMMPGSKPGEPPKETPMVLTVNQREGEVEVLSIDETAGTITFNNHGQIQTLSLEKDGVKPPTGPAATPFPGITAPGIPGVPAPTAGFNPARSGAPAGTTTTFGGAGSTLKNIPSRSLRLPTAAPVNAGGGLPILGGAANTTPQTQQTPQPKPLSAEEQAAIMLIQHEADPNGPPPVPLP